MNKLSTTNTTVLLLFFTVLVITALCQVVQARPPPTAIGLKGQLRRCSLQCHSIRLKSDPKARICHCPQPATVLITGHCPVKPVFDALDLDNEEFVQAAERLATSIFTGCEDLGCACADVSVRNVVLVQE